MEAPPPFSVAHIFLLVFKKQAHLSANVLAMLRLAANSQVTPGSSSGSSRGSSHMPWQGLAHRPREEEPEGSGLLAG